MSRFRRRKRQMKLKGKNPRGDAAANPLMEIGTGHEHLTTAATMYREMEHAVLARAGESGAEGVLS